MDRALQPLGLLGRELAGARAGLLAAALGAVYPYLWVNDGLILAETFATLGTVGAMQGLGFATLQNAMAGRHARASLLAQELSAALELQGRGRLLGGDQRGFPSRCGCACCATGPRW